MLCSGVNGFIPERLLGLDHFARNAWTLLHQSAKRVWGWNRDDPLPIVEWEVEPGVPANLDLGRALEDAARFNRWETLVG